MAKAQRNSIDYSSIDDLSLPRGASIVRYMEEHGPIQERSNSDSNLNLISPQSWSSLSVDKTVFWLRDVGKTPDSKVRVEWDIKEDVGAQDWIGLFYSGEEDAKKFLDCKIRGSSGGSTGAIIWDLEVVEHLFTEAKNLVCFKYISGNSGQVLATSTPVTVFIVKNDLRAPFQVSSSDGNAYDNALYCLTIQDLYASNLKKGMIFNSDPYVKFQVLPHSQRDCIQKHHYREYRSSVAFNTANPSWPSEKFKLEVLVTDLLDIEVKHKFSKSKPMMSRFLGHATIPVQNIVDRISTAQQKPVDFRLELLRKGPSDNVSGEVGFKANIYLLLQPLSNDASTSKVNGGLQRQASLPSTLTWVEDSAPRPSQIRHRHTDPGLAVTEALNLLSPRGVISEEQEDSDLGSPADSIHKTHTKKAASNSKLTSGSATVFSEPDSTSLNSEGHLTSNPETPLDSSDSGTSVSVISSCENSGGSIPSGTVVQSVYKPSHLEASETSQSLTQTLQPSSVQHNCDKTDAIIPAIANGQIACGDTVGSHSHLSDLDMSVQSAGLEYSLSGLRIDAPTLPPRTYKAAAPPVPPRINKASAPPIPPRQAIEKPKHKGTEHSRSALEPPPPLPPRTYSPVEFREEIVDGVGTAASASSDICSSREQELFPWGTPAGPATSNLSGTHSKSLQPDASAPSSNVSAATFHENNQQALVTAASSTLLPVTETNLAELQLGHSGHKAPSRSGVDILPGSRGSLALSTVSEPPVLTLVGQPDSCYLKRRSVDGIVQLTGSQPPRLFPRQRQLSTEERHLNRQQISQHLEQWTRSRQTCNPSSISTPNDQPSPPPYEHASPQLVPASTFPPNGVPQRQADSTDGHPHSAGRSVAQSQAPSSLNGSTSSSSTSTARERSADRRTISVDGSEVSNKRPVKYHRVDDRDDALPSGWEARVDSHGRIFYIDHVNRTTTWQRPQIGLPAVQRRTLSSEQRQQLDRRYQSIRRTMSQSQQQAEADNAPPGEPRDITGASNQPDQSPSAASPPERVSERSERSVYKLPAVKFLTRPDFFPMLQANESAMVDYNRNSKLKHMITKIRRDPKTFERYQHNRDLVSFVNLFCDTSKELPRRWEMKYDRAGKAFFIDHVLRTTTFMDPRLPTDVPLINPDFLQNPAPRTRAVRTELEAPLPPPRPTPNDNTAAIPTAYNEKVVLFLRQPNVDELLRDRCPQFASSSSLRDKIAKISARGVEMLERYSNDIDLTLLLSLFENEIMSYVPPTVCARNNQVMEATNQGSPQGSPVQRLPGRVPAPYKRDFQAKLRNFYKKLESKGYGQGPGKLKLTVRRDHVLEDAFNKIMSTPKKELQKNKLYITFAGEEGLDYGGPSREFFFLLSRELFNPYYGLFEYSANDTYTVQVSPLSTIVENAHEWFRFSGRVLGLALVHQYLLDAFFTRPFYKSLLRVPLSLEDVESLDMEFHQSLLWIKDNDISEVDLDLTFSVSEEVFGQVTERELKPNGKNISVTERNKKEYIEKMVKWRLERGVTEQTESLIRGFHEVLDGRLVSTFDARELELVIAGTVEIDITDWRRNTDYRSGYHDQHAVIQWFWEAIEKFDNERQLRLLQFVTGSSSIPYEGFSALRGSNGPRKFCIEKWGKTTSLPRAHTCFNRLDLPPYTSFEMLFEKLVMAVEETSTFGID
ncbi:unnamed protein product [Candidula unifasciata]|uniref:HECT-type E3 ubiquitin transferase n=1 Tax=Candidula unifasciata TaxID=100452 RepID=A0A8S4A290_9EUPU|nr:unnamed protein product [Candidula unifasciata]